MAQDREFEIRNGVLFDRRNVHETAQYCRIRNGYLLGRAESNDAAAELLVADVLQQIKRGDCIPGQLLPIFNAWAVVDVPTPGTAGLVRGLDISHARLHVNFFVRLGRQPELHAVDEGDCRS